ncbi:MAG: DHH family phosphoesterase [Candidatus Micrarchaeia archaeon]|jgi:RecJ-like exonuclease
MSLKKIDSISEEGDVTIAGRVMRSHESQSLYLYTILDEGGSIDVASYSPFPLGDYVQVHGTAKKHGSYMEVYAIDMNRLIGDARDIVSRDVEKALAKECEPLKVQKQLVEDDVMSALAAPFDDAARRIRRAIFSFRPIMLRYNGDADGICAGLCIKRAIEHHIGRDAKRRLFFAQNNPAVYSEGDALRDVSLLRMLPDQMGTPLVILVDFAANSESLEAIELHKGAANELLIVDHHPFDPKMPVLAECFVSPMTCNGTSHYCTGLLAGEIAKRVAEVDIEEFQKIAMAGDRSKLIEADAEHLRIAQALDFLAIYQKAVSTLDFYDTSLQDKKFMDSVYEQSVTKMKHSADVAKEFVKMREFQNGFILCKIRMDAAAKKGEFPTKGKTTGAVHDEFAANTDRPLVTLGYGERMISIRANPQALARGFNASKMIEALKADMSNSIESGGGHAVAASIKVNKGFGKIVLDWVCDWIEKL